MRRVKTHDSRATIQQRSGIVLLVLATVLVVLEVVQVVLLPLILLPAVQQQQQVGVLSSGWMNVRPTPEWLRPRGSRGGVGTAVLLGVTVR
jgi:hypothetical protein